jgi:REP element-mobilizing transposase RayT
MSLNQLGQIVAQVWEWLSIHYSYVINDGYVVMPNHFHGILQITELDDFSRGGSRPAPTKVKSLGELIGAFKTRSAKYINLACGTSGHPVWQRNYYERIILNSDELNNIHNYIFANPDNWLDYPENFLLPQRSLP